MNSISLVQDRKDDYVNILPPMYTIVICLITFVPLFFSPNSCELQRLFHSEKQEATVIKRQQGKRDSATHF